MRIEYDLRSSRPNLGFIIVMNKCKWLMGVHSKVLEASNYIYVCIYNLPKNSLKIAIKGNLIVDRLGVTVLPLKTL